MATCPQRRSKAAGETRNCAVEFTGSLDGAEVLSGTPVVTASPSGLTITNKQRNNSAITVDGVSCLASQAVQFTVAGGTAGKVYTITVTCDTNGGQVAVERKCKLEVT